MAIIWSCLTIAVGIGSWAAGRLAVPRQPVLPEVVTDTAPRVPVLSLSRRGAGAVTVRAEGAEVRFLQGSVLTVIPPGGSAIISLP